MEKIDMSLDDIIKLNKKESRKTPVRNERGRGRGNRARGSSSGRGSRKKVIVSKKFQTRVFSSNQRGAGRGRGGRGRSQGVTRGGGGGGRGRSQGITQGVAGRGRSQGILQGGGGGDAIGRGRFRSLLKQKQKTGISPLNRRNEQSQNRGRENRGRGRGRGRGTSARGRSNTIQGRSPQTGIKSRIGPVRNQKGRRGGGGGGGLEVRRQQAVTLLRQAKNTLAQINMQARQQTQRENTVNQNRGFKNLGNQRNANPRTPVQVETFGVVSVNNPKRRQWRTPKQGPAVDNSGSLTVSIHNASTNQTQRTQWGAPAEDQPNSLTRQHILNLKPAKKQTYKFNRNIFGQAQTGLSLNARFSSDEQVELEGRQVFF